MLTYLLVTFAFWAQASVVQNSVPLGMPYPDVGPLQTTAPQTLSVVKFDRKAKDIDHPEKFDLSRALRNQEIERCSLNLEHLKALENQQKAHYLPADQRLKKIQIYNLAIKNIEKKLASNARTYRDLFSFEMKDKSKRLPPHLRDLQMLLWKYVNYTKESWKLAQYYQKTLSNLRTEDLEWEWLAYLTGQRALHSEYSYQKPHEFFLARFNRDFERPVALLPLLDYYYFERLFRVGRIGAAESPKTGPQHYTVKQLQTIYLRRILMSPTPDIKRLNETFPLGRASDAKTKLKTGQLSELRHTLLMLFADTQADIYEDSFEHPFQQRKFDETFPSAISVFEPKVPMPKTTPLGIAEFVTQTVASLPCRLLRQRLFTLGLVQQIRATERALIEQRPDLLWGKAKGVEILKSVYDSNIFVFYAWLKYRQKILGYRDLRLTTKMISIDSFLARHSNTGLTVFSEIAYSHVHPIVIEMLYTLLKEDYPSASAENKEKLLQLAHNPNLVSIVHLIWKSKHRDTFLDKLRHHYLRYFKEEMPPVAIHQPPFTKSQRDAIREWIRRVRLHNLYPSETKGLSAQQIVRKLESGELKPRFVNRDFLSILSLFEALISFKPEESAGEVPTKIVTATGLNRSKAHWQKMGHQTAKLCNKRTTLEGRLDFYQGVVSHVMRLCEGPRMFQQVSFDKNVVFCRRTMADTLCDISRNKALHCIVQLESPDLYDNRIQPSCKSLYHDLGVEDWIIKLVNDG